MNKDDSKVLMRAAETFASEFRPTETQMMAKSRLHKALASKKFLVDENNLRIEDLEVMCGSRSVEKWCTASPMFLLWLLDRDFEEVKLAAYAQIAIGEVFRILQSDFIEKTLTAKDKLKAAEILLNLADKFPSKKKEITYLDKDVANMDGDTVNAELVAARQKITGG